MLKVLLAVLCLLLGLNGAMSQCISGLNVFNRSHTLLMDERSCNNVVDVRSVSEAPILTFNKASSNETYLVMLLESVTRSPDIFILHWLVTGVKSHGTNLATIPGGQDLTAGYHPPVNHTQYEYRLYNMTGKNIWETISNNARYDFFPSQWLAKSGIHQMPLAKTVFTVRTFLGGPPGWSVSPFPGGQPQHPGAGQQPVYPVQNPPSYPVQQPPQPVYPVQQPPQPSYPVQQPPQPSYPVQQPPQAPYPTNVQPPSGYPHNQPPIYSQQPPQPQYPPSVQTGQSTHHIVPKALFINDTRFSIYSAGHPTYNLLNINSTLYNSDSYNKKFKLSPYLIINNVNYIRRNITHSPGNGEYYYVNGTLYVPYSAPSKIVHHHHFHKNSVSSLAPTVLFIISLPLLLKYT